MLGGTNSRPPDLPAEQPGHRRQYQGKSKAKEQKCLLYTHLIGEPADQWACTDKGDSEDE